MTISNFKVFFSKIADFLTSGAALVLAFLNCFVPFSFAIKYKLELAIDFLSQFQTPFPKCETCEERRLTSNEKSARKKQFAKRKYKKL